MKWFTFLLSSAVLFTAVRLYPIEKENHSEILKNKLWLTNRTLTWKLEYNDVSYDLNEIRENIQKAFNDWSHYTKLKFHEVNQNEKADFNLVLVSNDQSDGILFDGPGGHIYRRFPISGKWSYRYDGISYNLRLIATDAIGYGLGLRNSDDHHLIMSPFYRLMQSNKIFSQQDKNSIQAFHGEKEITWISSHPNRRIRSIITKQAKAKKHKIMTEKDSRKKDEQEIIRFPDGEQDRIIKILKETQYDDALISFKNLSTMIDKAANILPIKVLPILHQLNISYLTITTKIDTGFTSTADILSQFIMKSWKMIQHGMSQDDKIDLINIEKQLNSALIDQLHVFAVSSSDALINIQSQLLLEATGGKIQNLLDKRNELEIEVLRLSLLLRNKSSERAFNQNIINLLERPLSSSRINLTISRDQTITDTIRSIKNISSRFNGEYETERNKIKLVAAKLKENAQRCKTNLQERRNSLFDRRRPFFSMRQNFRNAHAGDMSKNFRENLRNFMTPSDLFGDANETIACNIDQEMNHLREQGTKISTKFINHSEIINKEIMAITIKLKDQINEFKNKIEGHLKYRLEQQAMVLIYSSKVRNVHTKNDQKLIQENIHRLIKQNNLFQNILQNRSTDELVNTLLDENKPLSFYKTNQIELEKQYKDIKEHYDRVLQQFYSFIAEIDKIYRSTGTVNVESMKAVDELCRAIQSGHESITSTYVIMRLQLLAISVDPDLLVSSVIDAIKVLNMIDSYLDTRKLGRVKQLIIFKQ